MVEARRLWLEHFRVVSHSLHPLDRRRSIDENITLLFLGLILLHILQLILLLIVGLVRDAF